MKGRSGILEVSFLSNLKDGIAGKLSDAELKNYEPLICDFSHGAGHLSIAGIKYGFETIVSIHYSKPSKGEERVVQSAVERVSGRQKMQNNCIC